MGILEVSSLVQHGYPGRCSPCPFPAPLLSNVFAATVYPTADLAASLDVYHPADEAAALPSLRTVFSQRSLYSDGQTLCPPVTLWVFLGQVLCADHSCAQHSPARCPS